MARETNAYVVKQAGSGFIQYLWRKVLAVQTTGKTGKSTRECIGHPLILSDAWGTRSSWWHYPWGGNSVSNLGLDQSLRQLPSGNLRREFHSALLG